MEANEAGLNLAYFSSTMWRDTLEEQVLHTLKTSFDVLEVIACGVYGAIKEANKITKRFPLFK